MKAKVIKKAVKKDKQYIKGQNIRFSSEGHKKIVKYCKENGFNIGVFCERHVLRAIDTQQINLSN